MIQIRWDALVLSQYCYIPGVEKDVHNTVRLPVTWCWCLSGLHIGLKSLVDGGIPPRLLIIDDGWQSTDVDAELRMPVSEKLRLAEPMPELDETQSEFIEAELEMLSMTVRDVPAGSTLGTPL